MTDLFVVLGERGEYSDRAVFVSGIYASREEAQSAMIAALERRRIYDSWYNEQGRRTNEKYQNYYCRERGEYFDQLLDAADAPPYEMAERCLIVRVTLGEWHPEGFDEDQIVSGSGLHPMTGVT